MESGEPGGQQRRAGISATRTSGKGGAQAAARGTERGGRRKKGDGARWLLCAGTEGKNGEKGPGCDEQLSERGGVQYSALERWGV
jgi:hypothetical protein